MAASWEGANRASKGDLVSGQVSARRGAGGLVILLLPLCQPLETLLGFQGKASNGTDLDATIVAKKIHPFPHQLVRVTASPGRSRLPAPFPLARDGRKATTSQRSVSKRVTTFARKTFKGSNVGDDGGWLLMVSTIHAHREGDLTDGLICQQTSDRLEIP